MQSDIYPKAWLTMYVIESQWRIECGWMEGGQDERWDKLCLPFFKWEMHCSTVCVSEVVCAEHTASTVLVCDMNSPEHCLCPDLSIYLFLHQSMVRNLKWRLRCLLWRGGVCDTAQSDASLFLLVHNHFIYVFWNKLCYWCRKYCKPEF